MSGRLNKYFILFVSIFMGSSVIHAEEFYVYAKNNSSSGGIALNTGIMLEYGQNFSITVDPNDYWRAGSPPRLSNADGLTHSWTNNSTNPDPSGDIWNHGDGGKDYGLSTQDNLTAPIGALVAKIGEGDYFIVGDNYTGQANSFGELKLLYWDTDYLNNSGSVIANISINSVFNYNDFEQLFQRIERLQEENFAMHAEVNDLKKKVVKYQIINLLSLKQLPHMGQIIINTVLKS